MLRNYKLNYDSYNRVIIALHENPPYFTWTRIIYYTVALIVGHSTNILDLRPSINLTVDTSTKQLNIG